MKQEYEYLQYLSNKEANNKQRKERIITDEEREILPLISYDAKSEENTCLGAGCSPAGKEPVDFWACFKAYMLVWSLRTDESVAVYHQIYNNTDFATACGFSKSIPPDDLKIIIDAKAKGQHRQPSDQGSMATGLWGLREGAGYTASLFRPARELPSGSDKVPTGMTDNPFAIADRYALLRNLDPLSAAVSVKEGGHGGGHRGRVGGDHTGQSESVC